MKLLRSILLLSCKNTLFASSEVLLGLTTNNFPCCMSTVKLSFWLFFPVTYKNRPLWYHAMKSFSNFSHISSCTVSLMWEAPTWKCLLISIKKHRNLFFSYFKMASWDNFGIRCSWNKLCSRGRQTHFSQGPIYTVRRW